MHLGRYWPTVDRTRMTNHPEVVLPVARRIGENYAATLAEAMRREAAAGACFSLSQAATSSGSKRTEPEIRNDGMLPLAAIL
jgi:hypothetical protein